MNSPLSTALPQREDYQAESRWHALVQAADWNKGQGLLPAVIQDADSAQVLMLGYMDAAALIHTLNSGWVSFYSRSRQQLWTKGETSGHGLALVDIALDCDQDSFLVQAHRLGPVCHTGTRTCWGQEQAAGVGFLAELGQIIHHRAEQHARGADQDSYTARLLQRGLPRIAQKVGEEGVECALAAVTADDDELLGEAADLIYHLQVLLRARQLKLEQVCQLLAQRHRQRSSDES